MLRGIRRVRVGFARNLLLRFRPLCGVGFFIGSATAEDHCAAGEENQTQAFHAHINNRRSPDFQQRYLPFGAAGLRESRLVTCTVNFEKSAADFAQPLLGQREVLVQPIFEDVADSGEIEVVSQPPGKSFRFVGVMRFG